MTPAKIINQNPSRLSLTEHWKILIEILLEHHSKYHLKLGGSKSEDLVSSHVNLDLKQGWPQEYQEKPHHRDFHINRLRVHNGNFLNIGTLL